MDTIHQPGIRRLVSTLLVVLWMVGVVAISHAQDTREALGPKDKPAKVTGNHPLTELMSSLNPRLKPELRGQHPRVYVTEAEIKVLRERARTTHRDLWQRALQNVRALKQDAPPAPAQERRAQNEVGIGIAEAALAYKIEGDKKYLEAAKRYMDAAVTYEVWGYTYNKPNVDLAAGHLLYGMGWGYDLLYHDLTEAERARYREKIAKHARLLADYYRLKPGRTFSYSQNHVFIPMAGLGVAAYALYDEVADAPEWARLARAIYARVLATYSPDGYYYEGFEYWIFSTPWVVHYLDAHAHATGEDLYDQPGLKQTHLYVAHSLLPGGQYVFDFGDVFEGALTRAGKGEEYQRSHPGGRFHTNYNLLYRLASRFRSGETQGVAEWMKGLNHLNAEDYWSLLWYDPSVPATPISEQPASHYFPDHEVVFWRSDWTPNATAFAFKCGPPEGHHTAAQQKDFPDWHLSTGHAHPDANSFMIYARGRLLTGDTGYAGVPMTAHHNTLLVDGRGQAREGKGHDAFDGVPYDQMNQVRITEVKLEKGFAYVRGEAAAAYEPELGLTRFTRHLLFTAPDGFIVWDEVAANQPCVFTRLLHADERIEAMGRNQFAVKAQGVNLLVTSVAPEELKAKLEPNVMTAPGRPGSVDKGEQQSRGMKLSLSNGTPTANTRFVMLLQIADALPQ
ncbi:MAG TPA: DUF4962 domain-containing protein [Blastocatellia bacterium]|nr:DUF4962 domain-containing protein [Blastocatellia bacterium]